MNGRNINVYFQEKVYEKIKNLIEKRQVSNFVNRAVINQLQRLEFQKKKELRQKLISGYQKRAGNNNLQEEINKLGKRSSEDILTEGRDYE